VLTNESVEPRESLEARVAAWERSSSMAEGPGAEGENPPPAVVEAAKPPQKVLTDEELAAKIRELYQEQSSFGPQAGTEIEKVESRPTQCGGDPARIWLPEGAAEREPLLLGAESPPA